MTQEETFAAEELLLEARQMEAVTLPEAVRAQLTGFDVVRLRLLTCRNVLAAMMWAAQNPDRFNCFRLHYLCPELKGKEIAARLKIGATTVRRYLQTTIVTSSVWNNLPEQLPDQYKADLEPEEEKGARKKANRC